jgi:putative alpha-1,2-mannosidase
MTGSVITAGTTRTQAGATPITSNISTINTSTAATAGTNLGDGVALPQVSSGTDTVYLINNTANPVQVYAFNGSTDTINGIAGSTGVALFPYSSTTLVEASPGSWQSLADTSTSVGFTANTSTAAATLTAASVTSGEEIAIVNMSGTLAGAAALTLPTAAAVLSSMASPAVGSSFLLRVLNSGAGAFAWTVTTATGWTLTGSMAVANLTSVDFVATVTSATTMTLQRAGTGVAP